MATWHDVRALASALPETSERPDRVWRVRDRPFVFVRPLRRADHEHLGPRAPLQDPLGAWVPDLGAKEALLADPSGAYLTTPHFDGYPVVLVRVDHVPADQLTEVVVDAWLARAPRRAAAAWLAAHGSGEPSDRGAPRRADQELDG